LFLDVCDAVAFAHTRLVVHRDIKPANILIGNDGKAKLLDFGIAKLLDTNAVVDGHHTLHLSAAYAAPEQLSGAPVSTATDVYALGVTLFELLTGRLPWTGDAGALATALKRLVDAPVPLPSRSATLGSVPARALEGDIDAIVSMALRKDPAARHPDARALADDIRRHLAHEPVVARSGARSYVLRRFARRNWKVLTAVAVTFVAFGIAIVAVAWQAQRAHIEAQRAEAIRSFMLDVFHTNSSKQPDPVAARQTSARALLDMGAQRIETASELAPESRLSLLQTFASLYYDLGLSADERHLRDQAVALTRTVYGARSTELVEALIDQSSAQLGAGSVGAAQLPLDEARKIIDARGDTATDLRGRLLMATTEYFQASDLPRAAADADAAVAIFASLPASRDLLADALYMAGLLDTRVGKIDAAVAALDRAIALSRETAGDPNPKLSILYYQLAEAQSARLQSDDAEVAARKSIDYALAVNGEDHADTLRARMMLGRVLLEAGRARESVEMERQVRDKALRTLGADDNSHVRAALTIAGRAQVAAGDLDEGLADLRAALAILRAHSPGLLAEAVVLEDIAAGLLELGRSSEAIAALDEAATIRERVHQPAGDEQTLPRVRAALDGGDRELARRLLAGMDLGEAATQKEIVLRLRKNVLEAELALAAGDTAAVSRIADTVRAATGSSPRPLLRLLDADVAILQGTSLLRGGSVTIACPLLAHALATRTEFLSQQSPKIAATERALAACYFAAGRGVDADQLTAKADGILRQHSSLAARYRIR
jgi:tetratricopeptide (TPR) repeat protein